MMMTTNELWRMSAHEMAGHVARREISSREIVQSCLDRIAEVNADVNAVVSVSIDEALAAADAADDAVRRKQPLGVLHGVPVTTKVNVDQRGLPTTNGVVSFADTIATDDSPTVSNLRSAGAILIGRNNAPAFSFRWFTDNSLHGRTLNPHDANRTPGGSSGGAAVAVATGMGPIAHGNDLGGSIRYPAYACGVYGLRPSLGRVPAYNPSATAERTLTMQLASVQGPLARNVADLRLSLKAMSARDVCDPWWVPVDDAVILQSTGRRVALCTAIPGYVADTSVAEALTTAARWLEDAGYSITEVAPPDLRGCANLWLDLCMAEARASMLDSVNAHGDAPIRHAFRELMSLSSPLDLPGYIQALSTRSTMLRQWMAFFEHYDVLLMPVTWASQFPVDLEQRDGGFRSILDSVSPLLATAAIGLPGLAVPVGKSNGLPTGVQLVGGRFREERLLEAALEIEVRRGELPVVEPRARETARPNNASL